MTNVAWWRSLVVTTENFFTRFSQVCHGKARYTFDQFIDTNSGTGLRIGQALGNDVLFMNPLRLKYNDLPVIEF
jgi:hypothetical protein